MQRLGWVLILVGMGAVGTVWWIWPRQPAPGVTPSAARPAAPPRVEPRGRLPEEPQAELLAAARQALGSEARLESCGPYPLWTDVRDARLIAACGRLASKLDALYAERYGVRPRGQPAEAIVLFAEIAGYRTFARGSGVPLGYAGYALGARGLAVFYAGDQPFESFVKTLAHELTHLLNRRALGINLPPWLSEGLADGIGDTATPDGFRPLEGVRGSEAQARRLREAYDSKRARGLAQLVKLGRGDFDREAVSFDYEQSALLVRFLLSQDDLAPAFRAYLRELSLEAPYAPERLQAALGAGWDGLDSRFGAWVLTTR